MPSHVVSTRVTPYAYERLVDLAQQRGLSLSAQASRLLTQALEAGDGGVPAADGPLVEAVRAELADVTSAASAIHRELAVHLARAIERREPGYLQAVPRLETMLGRARDAQRVSEGADFVSLLGLGLGNL